MKQQKYQKIDSIKVSLTEQFYWVKCSTAADPNRTGILQSYLVDRAPKLIEAVQPKIDKLLSLNHPHLQPVIDVFATDDSIHIVQAMGEWESAIDRVPYSPVRAKILLQEILSVLNYLHERDLVHGNISHETIVIDESNRNILTNFLVIADLINDAGGETYTTLRAQLEQIPVANLPTGREWDLYSLGVTTIALLTDRNYEHLYDLTTKKWKWESYVDCSEELTDAIDRLLGQEKQPLQLAIEPLKQQSALQITSKARTSALSKLRITNINSDLYRPIIGSLLCGIVGLLGYLSWDKLQNKNEANLVASQLQSFPQKGTLTVGYINRQSTRNRTQRRDYPKFQAYLEAELRKKYGDNIKVELDSAITGREAQAKLAQKKWDLAFTFLANNSLIAEDNNYEFVARMAAGEDPYRDVCLYVKNGSGIRSSKDFTADRTIALPSEDSPIFTMPFYDLYGKRMRVNIGNTLVKIQEKVKSGEADIGVDFCKIVARTRGIRALSPNRVIPVGGVFLSPTIENAVDRDYIKEAIARAPEDIQVKANYTSSPGINYAPFRRINDRANQLLECVDFTRNPVEFYCSKRPENQSGGGEKSGR
jgi:serine/threonine protein kinase